MTRSVLLCSLLLLACAPLVAQNHALAEEGEVLIYTTSAGRLVVAMDSSSGGADGLIDRWFVLQSDAVIPPHRVHYRRANIVFREGALRVTAGNDLYELTVTDIPAAPSFGRRNGAIRIEGYGLSHTVLPTDVAIRSKRSVSSEEACGSDYCDPLDYYLNTDLEQGGGGTTCDSGGLGATSCSITNGAKSCSVTCNSVSYPCCRVTSTGGVSCTCKHS